MEKSEFEVTLDALSECFLTGNFGLWRSLVQIPLTLVTSAGHIVLRDEVMLGANFLLYLKSIEIQRVDAIVRRSIALEQFDEDAFFGTYETEYLRNGLRLVEPYESTAIIRCDNDKAKISFISNALDHHRWTSIPPRFDSHVPTDHIDCAANGAHRPRRLA